MAAGKRHSGLPRPADSGREQTQVDGGNPLPPGSQLPQRVLEALVQAHERVEVTSLDASRFNSRAFDSRDETERVSAVEACLLLASQVQSILSSILDSLAALSAPRADATIDISHMTSKEPTRRQEASLNNLEQVSFLAGLEILRVQGRVSAIKDSSTDSRVFQAASLLRKVFRGLSAVDQALAQVLEVEDRVRTVDAESGALRVRRTYAWFRRGFDLSTEPSREEMVKTIRRLGTRIASLVGRDGYGELRPDDRLLFSNLQKRVLSWLSLVPPPYDEGRRLWDDFRAMADILRQVNLRPELVTHDARVGRLLLDELLDTQHLGPHFLERLRALEGFDEELDMCIASDRMPDRTLVERVLRRASNLPASKHNPWTHSN